MNSRLTWHCNNQDGRANSRETDDT